MTALAQVTTVLEVFELFGEAVGYVPALLIIMLGLAVGASLLLSQRMDLAILGLVAASVLTGLANPVVANVATFARWFFLVAAAGLAVMRPGQRYYVPIVLLMALWVAINAITTTYTPAVQLGVVRTVFFALVLPGLIIALGPPAFTLDQLVVFLRRIALVGVGLSLVHLAGMAFGPAAWGTLRYKGFFAAPQIMSMATTSVTLPIIWALLSRNAGRWGKVFTAALLINLMAMIASTQRTGLMTLAGATLLMLSFYRARGLAYLMLAVLFTVIVGWPIISILTPQKLLKERLLSMEAQSRMEFWRKAYDKASDSPIIGYGNGSSTLQGQIWFRRTFHSSYLEIFYSMGIVGLVTFLPLIGVGALTALRLTRSITPQRRALGVYLFAAFAMVTVQGITESSLWATANETAVLFYIALGLTSSATKIQDDPYQSSLYASPYALPSSGYPGQNQMLGRWPSVGHTPPG